MHRPPLLPTRYSWGWVDPRAVARPEGWSQWKMPMTTSAIEPATFRLVAQCDNQLRHHIALLHSAHRANMKSRKSQILKQEGIFWPPEQLTALEGRFNSGRKKCGGGAVQMCKIKRATEVRNVYIKKTNLMQSSSMFIGNCKIALHVSVAFCVHLQEH